MKEIVIHNRKSIIFGFEQNYLSDNYGLFNPFRRKIFIRLKYFFSIDYWILNIRKKQFINYEKHDSSLISLNQFLLIH